MALEHALLVALRERPAAGLELARRFDRSIGFFWSATHQQIYRVLRRMEDDGWVEASAEGRKRVFTVTDRGADVLADWLAEPSGREAFRSDLAVRLRGASYGDRAAVLDDVRGRMADAQARHDLYSQWCARDYPDPGALEGADLDRYLVLRGGLLQEEFTLTWLTEYLEAHA